MYIIKQMLITIFLLCISASQALSVIPDNFASLRMSDRKQPLSKAILFGRITLNHSEFKEIKSNEGSSILVKIAAKCNNSNKNTYVSKLDPNGFFIIKNIEKKCLYGLLAVFSKTWIIPKPVNIFSGKKGKPSILYPNRVKISNKIYVKHQ